MKRKRGRGLWLHKPKCHRRKALNSSPASNVKEVEGRETTGTLWTTTGGLQNVGHAEVYMNDSILNKAENETSGGLSGDDITGGHYEQVRQMCDNLWKDGIESLVLTVNTRSKTVWSSGSINGSLFLVECQDLRQKFLKFCIGMTERPADAIKDETLTDDGDNDVDHDNDTSPNYLPENRDESLKGAKSLKRKKSGTQTSDQKKLKPKSKLEHAFPENIGNSYAKRKFCFPQIKIIDHSKSKESVQENCGMGHSTNKLSKQENSSMGHSRSKQSVQESSSIASAVPNGSGNDLVIITKVRNVKHERKSSGKVNTESSDHKTNELIKNKVVDFLIMKEKKPEKEKTKTSESLSVLPSSLTLSDKVKDSSLTLADKVKDKEKMEDAITATNEESEEAADDVERVVLKYGPKAENWEEMFECIADPSSVTIDKGGIGVVWPIDKVYEKVESETLRPYNCKICEKNFGTPSMVIRHVRSVHGSDTPYRCRVCAKLFKDKDAVLKHVRIHGVKNHPCSLCDKMYVDETRLKKHMKTHEKDKKNYRCELCELEFTERQGYKRHMSTVHLNIKVKCDECDNQFRDAFSLKRHKIVKHTTGKHVKCDICSKAFKLRDNMLLHRKRFHEAKYSCEICGVNQPTNSSLKKHIDMVHEKKNELICDVCGKGFIYMHRFRIHKRTHTGELPFKCSYCEKGYTNKESCMQHENTHTREREYICDICGQKYLQYGHLTRHKQLHDKSFKPIKCKYCTAGFRAYSAYRSHVFKEHQEQEMASGSGMILRCDYCPKLFAHPTHLQSHIYRHTGEKPYSCEHCGKKFNDKSNLRQHKFTHEDKDRFKCMSCGQTFTQRRTYRAHLKAHESKNSEKSNGTDGSVNVGVYYKVGDVITGDTEIAGKQASMNSESAAVHSQMQGVNIESSGENFNLENQGNYIQLGQVEMDQVRSGETEIIQIGQGYGQGHSIAGQGGTETGNQNAGVEEIYIVDIGNDKSQPLDLAGLQRLQQDGSGSVMELQKVPETVAEYQIQVEESAMNDGQNYVLVPQSGGDSSTILVWQDGQR